MTFTESAGESCRSRRGLGCTWRKAGESKRLGVREEGGNWPTPVLAVLRAKCVLWFVVVLRTVGAMRSV